MPRGNYRSPALCTDHLQLAAAFPGEAVIRRIFGLALRASHPYRFSVEGRQELLGELLHGDVLYFRKLGWDLSRNYCLAGGAWNLLGLGGMSSIEYIMYNGG